MTPGLTSIIIINYNTPELTSKLLASVHEYCQEDDFDIILIDNASNDSSIQDFQADYPDVSLIKNENNIGFARAANQGAQKSDGEYLWFLNSDCELTMPIMGVLKDAMAKDPNAAAVTPKTVDIHGNFHSVCRNFPDHKNIIFSRGSLLSRIPGLDKYARTYTLEDFAEMTRVDAIAATAMLIRKEDFELVGGFDERFFLYFEDTDLCLRLNREGRYCYYVPEAEIIHRFQASSRSAARRIRHHHRSAMEYFLKWYPRKILSNLGLFFMLTVNFIFQIIIAYAGMSRNIRH
ncbi:MAG: glycosyltransferase [candidate division Zixibacteria bacterium]|nr:glycosyltransferase [candidate division Zixibacteria bacterium]NIR68317.1 glycosyltransferase [candidate division Zixibacteria bacterium]NIS18298.1 glycosyltransferase [candidate division Zixibacteria bacterium]NIS49484.1 glycosyltransferase [candidate division Zixibacteria bacterium]NIT54621.1 glycosyltransferase [candidate division Zixibacteria bacterium]